MDQIRSATAIASILHQLERDSRRPVRSIAIRPELLAEGFIIIKSERFKGRIQTECSQVIESATIEESVS